MAVNLGRKDRAKVDQKFELQSLTKAAFGAKIDFVGVKTARIHTLTTQALGDYTRSGSNRYGTPTDVQDTVVEYSLTRDRSFSSVIDKGDELQQSISNKVGQFMKAQMDEQYIPEVDTYALGVLLASATSASHVPTAAALTTSNTYEKFLDLQELLDEDKTPVSGRICFMTPAAINFIKRDSSFIKASDIGQKMLINGQVGEIDGVKIVKVPSALMPLNTAMILTHPSANAMPQQLAETRIHKDAPGYSGALIEGRWIYDAFTFAQKYTACAAHKTAV